MSRQAWFLISLAYGTLFLYGLIDNSRGPVFPELLKDFSVGDGVGSLFFSVASASALVANLTGPWWLKRWGETKALRAFALLQTAALALLAASRDYAVLLVGSTLFGLGMGGLGLLVNVLTAIASPAEHRRRLMSGLHCMYGISSLLAPFMVTALYEAGSGWRAVFALLALGPLFVVVASFGAKDPSPAPVATTAALADEGEGALPLRRLTWYCAVISIYVIVEILIGTRLVLHARRDLGYGVEDANRLLSAFFLAMFAGRFFFAVVRVPFSHVALQFAAILSTSASIIAGLLAHPGFLALSGLTMSFYYPVTMARLSDELGTRTGTAMSWVLTVQSVGLLAMHAGIGALTDAVGLGRALWVGPVCLALVTVLLAFGARGNSVSKS